MPELTESKQLKGKRSYLPPLPRPLALLLIIVAALSLTAGLKQGELVTTLLGASLSVVLAYTFAGSFVLILRYRHRAALLSLRVVPEAVVSGRQGALVLNREATEAPFFRLPGILIRCESILRTRDNRRLELIVDPDRLSARNRDNQHISPFTVPLRGAYYGTEDKFLVMDILGLFRASAGLPSEPGARLLSMPEAAETPPGPETGGGGDEQRSGNSWTRTDNFIDHRPYTPGDDPRRINWKLYSHLGDLFIREGEREPPPHSKLTLLIDSQYDPLIYTPEGGSRGVDMLCENALALIIEYGRRGMELDLGYTGGKGLAGGEKPDAGEGRPLGKAAELAAALAYPAAVSLKEAGDLPAAPDAKRVLILALPRENATESSLDRFLRSRGSSLDGKALSTDILFLHDREELAAAAETCAAHYSKRANIRAYNAAVESSHKEIK